MPPPIGTRAVVASDRLVQVCNFWEGWWGLELGIGGWKVGVGSYPVPCWVSFLAWPFGGRLIQFGGFVIHGRWVAVAGSWMVWIRRSSGLLSIRSRH
jgi:hypothetical protein